MRFTLWMQLILGVQIRSVQRTRFSDEIKELIGQNEDEVVFSTASGSVTTTSPTISARAATSRVHSTPSHRSSQRQNSMTPVDRKRPASNSKEYDSVREARLRRFDKPANLPVPSADFLRNRPSWSCPQCTLENRLADEMCSACGGVSPMKRSSMAPSMAARVDWSCPRCTFQNKANDSNCTVCSASAMSPVASLSSNSYHADHSSSLPTKPSRAAPSSSKRAVRCGACGNGGHNRSNATEHNCPAYFDEKEIEKREKSQRKREQAIVDEREKIRAIERESDNAERMQEQLARQIEELERNKERAEDFRKEELKKRKQRVKRLQKQQNKNKP